MKGTKKDAKGLELLADALEITARHLDTHPNGNFYDDYEGLSQSTWLIWEAERLRAKAEKLREEKGKNHE